MKSPRSAALLVAAAACSAVPLGAPRPLCTGAPCALDRLTPLLDSAVAAGAAPGAVIAVSYRGARYIYGTGKLALDDPRRPDGNTVYDLASLTKVIATTTLAMQAMSEGRLELDAPVQRYLPAFRGSGKDRVTIRHLLTHSSGLPADKPLWRLTPNADSALRLVNAMPLDTAPGARMVYSDIGAIVLGEVIERVLGGRLDRLASRRIFRPLGMSSTRFRPPESWLWRVAPTEYDTAWRKRIVRGEVHDEKAAWLGGVAGHAGLFGSAVDLLTFGEWVLKTGRREDGNCAGPVVPSSRPPVRHQGIHAQTESRPRLLPCPGLGYAVTGQQRRNPARRRQLWAHRVHRHIDLDGSRPGAGDRAAHQPGPPNPQQPETGPAPDRRCRRGGSAAR